MRLSNLTCSWVLAPSMGLAQQAAADEHPKAELTFGVYAADKPTVVYRQFLPMLEALQVELSRTLDAPASVELRIFKTYDAAQDALAQGSVDFVRFGPSSYILVKARQPDVTLLAMEQNDGAKTFKGMIVVRKDSPIRTIADLRGKRFAFGDESSTIGRYLAQLQLVNAGITAKDLKHHAFLGRHDRVFAAVEVGDFDAGAVKENTFEKQNAKGTLRVLAQFDNVTKPWVARARLNARVAEALRTSLLGMKDPAVLADFGVTGFLPATDADYDPIRQAMAAAEKFTQSAPATTAPAPGR